MSRISLTSGMLDAVAASLLPLEHAPPLVSNRNPRFTGFRVAPKHKLNFIDAELVLLLHAPVSSGHRGLDSDAMPAHTRQCYAGCAEQHGEPFRVCGEQLARHLPRGFVEVRKRADRSHIDVAIQHDGAKR